MAACTSVALGFCVALLHFSCSGAIFLGSERRATQVGVRETGSVQLDRTRACKRSVLEVTVRQVRPAQVELLGVVAERGLAQCSIFTGIIPGF